MAYMLTPEQQANTYDKGYFYPGPAVKDVPLSMAPKDSQKAIKEFGRPEYEQMIAGAPLETPLDAKGQVGRVRKWDQRGRRREGEEVSARKALSELRLDGRHAARFGGQRSPSTVSTSRSAAASSSRCSARPGCGKSTALNCIAGLLPLRAAHLAGRHSASTRSGRSSAASAWCSRTTRCSRT